MPSLSLRAVTFLAPNMFPVYQSIIDYVSNQLGITVSLSAGTSYAQIADADLSFVCGLPYVLRTSPRLTPPLLEAIAAPVLIGERYQGRPIYFSDVIVRQDSPYQSFGELRGCSWAYNEEESQSGYGITRYTLVKKGETAGYFGEVVKAGFHQTAIRMVADGLVDASAIDGQVLAFELRTYPELRRKLREIDSLGPSTIQPIAVSTRLPESLKRDIRAAVLESSKNPVVRGRLDGAFISHYEAVDDSSYDDIRQMLAACERANFLQLA